MATNKNALIRYNVLDKCFRNPGRMYFWENLLEECNNALYEYDSHCNGIQRRQLFEDIKFMESSQGWSIPLERMKYGKKTYYRYSDLKFSINNQPLNESEVKQLKSTLMIMNRFTGTPHFEWVNEIIPVIENKLGLVEKDNQVIEFDSNLDYKGAIYISPLFNAIVNKRVLKVKYKAFKDPKASEIIFHPYYLKQFNNRWFVLGLNEKENIDTWNMALDRIEHIEETGNKYIETRIDWYDYFFDIVGVTKEAEKQAEDVVLKFAENQAPYVITKPIHPTQKDSFENDELVVRINVIPNYELEKLILSFGEDVEVVKPLNLRKRIKERLSKGLAKY